jgi:hypothetical protein
MPFPNKKTASHPNNGLENNQMTYALVNQKNPYKKKR